MTHDDVLKVVHKIGPATAREITEDLGREPTRAGISAVTGYLKMLVSQGRVVKYPNPNRARCTLWTIT